MKTVELPSNVWFFSGPECLSRMFALFLRELGEPPGRLRLFPYARSELFQNVHYSQGKKESRPGTRERPAKGPNLKKRDKFF